MVKLVIFSITGIPFAVLSCYCSPGASAMVFVRIMHERPEGIVPVTGILSAIYDNIAFVKCQFQKGSLLFLRKSCKLEGRLWKIRNINSYCIP